LEKDLKNDQLVGKKSPEEIDPKHKTSDTAIIDQERFWVIEHHMKFSIKNEIQLIYCFDGC
jgi:hypothetical protein